MKERAEVVERDLEEVNSRSNHHQGEINWLKIREKEVKEKVDQLEGSSSGQTTMPRSSRINWTGWRRMSANVDVLLQKLGKSLFLWRTRLGLNYPMCLPGGASMLLLQ